MIKIDLSLSQSQLNLLSKFKIIALDFELFTKDYIKSIKFQR
jgi:hypothetical protein